MHIFQNPLQSRVEELLTECGLPSDDLLDLNLDNFLGCGDKARPNGIIGLEVHGRDALLRSLAVSLESRGIGCAKALVSRIEDLARSKGILDLYLLTNTAEPFFNRLGYTKVERATVSEGVKSTQEFSYLCPVDAAVMRKSLEC